MLAIIIYCLIIYEYFNLSGFIQITLAYRIILHIFMILLKRTYIRMRKLECFIGAKIFSSIDLRQLHAMQFMLYMCVQSVKYIS